MTNAAKIRQKTFCINFLGFNLRLTRLWVPVAVSHIIIITSVVTVDKTVGPTLRVSLHNIVQSLVSGVVENKAVSSAYLI